MYYKIYFIALFQQKQKIMSNKVEVLSSEYILEDVKRPVVFTDASGNSYRVSFDNSGVGIVINKVADGWPDAICIVPKVSNEILIK